MFGTIGKSPKLDGRCNSRLLMNIMEEMAEITSFGSAKKMATRNSKQRRSNFVVSLEKRRIDKN
ncbi:unnamed protein product [Oikopleura dioica]|uniref:Uncharacterized protein n=1 Tax=Oikopleura dioica TaxID=34765 RepID=E4XYC2_OIKDI|nr:unnamed protein product [Oikopleura dioica]